MTPRQLLGQARVHTFEYLPYLASYVYSLREHETPGIGTAAVDDAGNLYWCPEYITSIGKETASYVILHETLHLIFDHHKRAIEMLGEDMTETERYICNVAADLVIEQTLHMMRHLRPEGAVCLGAKVPKLGIKLDFPENKSMQEYYRLITEKMKSNQQQQPEGSDGDDEQQQGSGESPDGSGSGDGDRDDNNSGQDMGAGDNGGGSGNDDDGTEADGKEDASGNGAGSPSAGQGKAPQAPCSPGSGGSCADGQRRPYEVESDGSWEAYGEDMAAAKAEEAIAEIEASKPGTVPGNIKEALKQKLRPQPDPFDQLRSAVCTSVASPVGGREFTHRRLSRKQPPGDDQPLLHGRICMQPKAVVIVDTSASMMLRETKAKALSVIGQGLRKLHRVKVYCADTHVRSNAIVSTTKRFEWYGGGGTDMAKAIEEVDRNEKPDSIILVTDAETDWCAAKPRARVVVAYTGEPDSHWHNAIPKWCRTVVLEKGGAA
jgi:predicted metal-dependent peptidase